MTKKQKKEYKAFLRLLRILVIQGTICMVMVMPVRAELPPKSTDDEYRAYIEENEARFWPRYSTVQFENKARIDDIIDYLREKEEGHEIYKDPVPDVDPADITKWSIPCDE